MNRKAYMLQLYREHDHQMHRRPQYNKAKSYRIISVPGQLWQLQRHSGQPGTREFDPWRKASLPHELAEAEAMLRKTDSYA